MSRPHPQVGKGLTETERLIAPIILDAYGESSFVYALVIHLAQRIDLWEDGDDERGRQYMVMVTCWDWMPGGTTAETVARLVEQALSRHSGGGAA